MYGISIEDAAERIVDPRTRSYFQEVLQTYVNGNYRSAIVMLWTVVICDLVYKLRTLAEVHEDKTAADILDEIERLQAENPRNSDWERKLVQLVHERSRLLSHAELHDLNTLREYRHLAAHPVLSQDDLLYQPNRETVRSNIRNALEAVLTKPPVVISKVFERLIQDLASNQSLFPDDDSLRRYLRHKYFDNLPDETAQQVFRKLWKFVFLLDNDDAAKHRSINYRALCILYELRTADLYPYIRDNAEKFPVETTDETLAYLIGFLARQPDVYDVLDTTVKEVLRGASLKKLDWFAAGFFRSANLTEHLATLKENVCERTWIPLSDCISEESWAVLRQRAEEAGLEDLLRDISIELYVRSSSFDTANTFFRRYVSPYLEHYSPAQVERLLTGTQGNRQTYERNRARDDHADLVRAQEEVIRNLDLSQLPHWRRLLEELDDPSA